MCGVSVRGGAGDVTDRGGITGFAEGGGCGGVSEVTGAAGGELVTTFVASGLASSRTCSPGALAPGVAGSVKIAFRTAGSLSCSCFGGKSVESAPWALDGRATGLAVGQLLTPPAWTVPHQAQKAGWVLSGFTGAGT